MLAAGIHGLTVDSATVSPGLGPSLLRSCRAGVPVGIFTGGDRALLIASHVRAALLQPIAELVICTPNTIQDDPVVDDLTAVLGERRIGEVPTVDPGGRRDDLADVQDLLPPGVLTDTGDAAS